MGWCSEFGCGIEPSCDHPMVAGRQSCSCEVCGVGCGGRFPGCRDVWAAGPKARPARKRATRTAQAAVTAAGPSVGEVATHAEPQRVAAPNAADDERLRSINETVERMGRQLRGVVKILNQQQQPATVQAPGQAVDDQRLTSLGEAVDRMGRELRGVLNLLIQQQTMLTGLTGSTPGVQTPRTAPVPAGDPAAAVPRRSHQEP